MAQGKKRSFDESNAPVEKDGIPRSMVIKMGNPKRKPTKALAALVRDFRQIMQPHTAARLKERKANKLKDYFVMAGPLGVTNFFIFSQSLSGNTTLRLARTPRGPTLYFRVNEYVLSRDIQKTQARPHALAPHSPELQNPPVLVMNNFSKQKTSDVDALVTSMFQNILPTIQVDATTSLGSVRRVLLLNRVPETGAIELRHYAVVTRVVGSTRVVKKLEAAAKGQGQIPNLHHLKSVAQYMVDPTASDSEGEDEVLPAPPAAGLSAPTTNAAQRVKKAVKLVEIGPRLNLTLLKVEEGLCMGKTLFHAEQTRTEKEIKAMERMHERKDSERARRRAEQEENVRRKREALAAKGTRRQRGAEKAKARAAADNLGPESERDADGADPHAHSRGRSESDDESDDEGAQDVQDMNDYELEAEAEYESADESEIEDEDEVED